ncbi:MULTISPECIES: DUF2332 domain-containing protein [unclassified Frigoribacterium]|uniref:DUF2332 domain-containing protein n=1 Tax=unclassified Frigoribacterium TaxID=2627005 RepID=UPI0006FE6984|nr:MULTISPECIES: DUF2332 domain-containing protein [unclassified Frigoribacterium]KQO47738.1 hypothetical protein ASF07_09885 [Frigoribacterium sp. Leaf254]KQT39831.1 hypothetical protein ASG28_09890 [Frigoribacterium sp. Leaf415]
MSTSDRFLAAALAFDREGSPSQAELARGIAGDPTALAVVDRAEEARRQPVLVLAVCRWLGAPHGAWSVLRPWLLARSDDVVAELGRRLTQTNDVRRCAPLSIALARVPGPVALIEVGASAGLCLGVDRYGYRSGDRTWGDASSTVQLGIDVVEGATRSRVELPTGRLPEVVWRAGIDLDPVDVRDPEQVAWLETLLPPERGDRRDLLGRAVALARTAPPRLVAADAVDGLAALVDEASTGATPVVVSTGTLVYLPGRRRQAFVDEVVRLGARWISYERRDLLTDVVAEVPPGVSPDDAFAALALDGRALGVGDAHGTRLHLTA